MVVIVTCDEIVSLLQQDTQDLLCFLHFDCFPFTMDVASFRLALQRCGVAQPEARNAIVAQGYDSMDVFKTLTEDEIEQFVKAVNKLPQAAPGTPRPMVAYVAIKNLKAMRNWAIECDRIGVTIAHDNFTDEERQRILSRMDEEANFATNRPATPPLPDKFTSFGPKWREFSEGLQGHCKIVHGCMNIPLAYLLREVEPDVAMLTAAFDTTDQRLMALVLCIGPEFQQDNRRLWDLLCPLIRGTPAWEYVKVCERSGDGRRAYRILKLRGEGEAAVDARRTKAEATLAKAQYTGKSKRFTLQSYINLLQGAFNDLEECGDPYSERKKVDTFVKGLVADRFAVVRATIMGDPVKRGDFQMAYGYVETMENLRSTTDGHGDAFDRNVSAMDAKIGKHKGGGRNRSGKKKHANYIPPEKWNKLTPEERKKIQSDRDRDKSNKGKGGKGKEGELKRKLSEIVADAVRDMDDIDGDGSGEKGKATKTGDTKAGPQDQFGRNVHAAVRFANKVVAELAGNNSD